MLIKNKIDVEIDKLENTLNDLIDKKRVLENDIENILNEIKNKRQFNEVIKNKNFLTDHAIIRFLERKKFIDIKKLKEELLTPGLVNAIIAGAKSYREDRYEYIIKQGKVITIIDLKNGN